jgi:hypothetical protein
MNLFFQIASGVTGLIFLLSAMSWLIVSSDESRNIHENQEKIKTEQTLRCRMAGFTFLWGGVSIFFYWLGS